MLNASVLYLLLCSDFLKTAFRNDFDGVLSSVRSSKSSCEHFSEASLCIQ